MSKHSSSDKAANSLEDPEDNFLLQDVDEESASTHDNLLQGLGAEEGGEAGMSHSNTKKCADINHLFTEEIPLIGRVPILFFVPECPEAANVRKQIHQFGGICIYIVECCCYQVYPEAQNTA